MRIQVTNCHLMNAMLQCPDTIFEVWSTRTRTPHSFTYDPRVMVWREQFPEGSDDTTREYTRHTWPYYDPAEHGNPMWEMTAFPDFMFEGIPSRGEIVPHATHKQPSFNFSVPGGDTCFPRGSGAYSLCLNYTGHESGRKWSHAGLYLTCWRSDRNHESTSQVFAQIEELPDVMVSLYRQLEGVCAHASTTRLSAPMHTCRTRCNGCGKIFEFDSSG